MMKKKYSSDKKAGGIRIGSKTVQWNPGQMNKMTVFVTVTGGILLLFWAINLAASYVGNLPEAKIRAVGLLMIVVAGFFIFTD